MIKKDKKKKEELRFVKPYFTYLEKRAAFLAELWGIGYKEDALLLCCCYIEAMGNMFYGGNRNQYNFFRILKEYGGEEVLMQIFPKQLWIGLKRAEGKDLPQIGGKISGVLKKHRKGFYNEDEILALVSSPLDSIEIKKLRKNLWRGTLASAAYMHLRNPLIHEMDAVEFSFDGITFKKEPAPILGFSILYRAMLSIFRKMQEISAKTGTLLGHDLDSIRLSYLKEHKAWEELEKGGPDHGPIPEN